MMKRNEFERRDREIVESYLVNIRSDDIDETVEVYKKDEDHVWNLVHVQSGDASDIIRKALTTNYGVDNKTKKQDRVYKIRKFTMDARTDTIRGLVEFDGRIIGMVEICPGIIESNPDIHTFWDVERLFNQKLRGGLAIDG